MNRGTMNSPIIKTADTTPMVVSSQLGMRSSVGGAGRISIRTWNLRPLAWRLYEPEHGPEAIASGPCSGSYSLHASGRRFQVRMDIRPAPPTEDLIPSWLLTTIGVVSAVFIIGLFIVPRFIPDPPAGGILIESQEP